MHSPRKFECFMPGTWQVSIMVSMSLMKKKNSKFTKPIRAKVETWDRVDNNFDVALKHMGYKRTNERDIKGKRSKVARLS